MKCLICEQKNCINILESKSRWKGQYFHREFFYCNQCQFVFLNPTQVLTPQEEQERYDCHENDLQQSGYRSFFAQFWSFICGHIEPPSVILDLGCGPTFALKEYLSGQAHKVDSYDPYYQPKKEELKSAYALIWCQEVFEHIMRPDLFIDEWIKFLEVGGHLALRTQLLPDLQDFANWHYHRDHTHISFFTQSGLSKLFASKGLSLVKNSSDMFLFKKE